MVPAALSEAIATDRASGKIPVAVVGTCGTTNTGSVDPLDALADICKAENLWFHVDGAYGGSVVLSDRAEVARGIERADSIVWDGHKWLYQIYGCALVLVKDVRTLLAAYSAGGEYLQDVAGLGQAPEWWDMGPELTRPARGPLLWLTLQVAGTKAMREMVSKSIRIAERFEQLVRESSFLEVVTPASLAIVTFSVKADNPEEAARRNLALSEYLRVNNIAGIFSTELEGRNVLLLCTISPDEYVEDFNVLIRQVEDAAKTLGF